MTNRLHIIAFNVPYPADYGGVYDVFYKIKALHAAGISICLHCFDYGRGQQEELNRYCESVWYYSRNLGHRGISIRLPYIVASRQNETLAQRLLMDNDPILIEGIHGTYPVLDERFKERNILIRIHNAEYQYYRRLFEKSTSIIKKLYYWNESRLLKQYESRIAALVPCLLLSHTDLEVYQQELGCTNATFLPLFLPDWEVDAQEGMGNYCLYHGDLSVEANEEVAIWLLKKIFWKLKIPFVIAGRRPSKKLMELAHRYPFTCLVADPGEKEMQDMISKAHINVLPSLIQTGAKVKLVNALFHGRHCVINQATIHGSSLETLCQIAASEQDFREQIGQLYQQPFSAEKINLRKSVLSDLFDHARNANKLIQLIREQG